MPKAACASYPLRRVLTRMDLPVSLPPGLERDPEGVLRLLLHEVLECGHAQRPKTDIHGETSAHRRRCRKCARGLPPDVKLDDLKPGVAT